MDLNIPTTDSKTKTDAVFLRYLYTYTTVTVIKYVLFKAS